MNNETSLSDLGKIIETERFALLRYACYRLGNKEDAEDAVHDCYLKLYKRFSTQQDTMVVDLNHYVFRSLSNLCTTRLSVSLKMESVPLDVLLFSWKQPGTTRVCKACKGDYRM